MKKLIAFLLASLMMLPLVSCGIDLDDLAGLGSALGEISKELGNLPSEGEISSIDSLVEALKPEGWDENGYGMYVYDVWDENFLPDVLPGPVEGILPDQTTFKDYKHDVLNSDYSVGPIEYESKEDYREYGVSFYATEAQLDAYMDAMKANGFVGTAVCDRSTSWWQFDFSHENGWFASVYFNTNANKDGQFDGRASISLTDSLYDRPESIVGIPLPQCGAVAYDYKNYCIQTFDDNGMSEPAFPLPGTAFPTGYYAAWFGYEGTVIKNAQDYAAQLKAAGWSIDSEKIGDSGDYYAVLKKGDQFCAITHYASGASLEIGFANMIELIQY